MSSMLNTRPTNPEIQIALYDPEGVLSFVIDVKTMGNANQCQFPPCPIGVDGQFMKGWLQLGEKLGAPCIPMRPL